MMTAQEAAATFDRQVVARTHAGSSVAGNNRGMARKDGRSCLAIETPGGFWYLPLEDLASVAEEN